eukprot:3493854-Rhodomonas_salina.1
MNKKKKAEKDSREGGRGAKGGRGRGRAREPGPEGRGRQRSRRRKTTPAPAHGTHDVSIDTHALRKTSLAPAHRMRDGALAQASVDTCMQRLRPQPARRAPHAAWHTRVSLLRCHARSRRHGARVAHPNTRNHADKVA